MQGKEAQRTVGRLLPDGLAIGAVVGTAVGGVAALALLLTFWDRMANHDIAWFLIATRKWLEGARLYVDLVEVNPPLNFYLTLPSVWLADLFEVSDTNGQYLAIALLCFASILGSALILSAVSDVSPVEQALLLVGAAAAAILSSLNGVGQREQVMLLCFLPWALREAWPERSSRLLTLCTAAIAAVGMCLKPYFVVLPLAVTILNVFQARSIRPVLSPSNLVFLGFGLAYLAFVRAWHPAYLSDIVPFGLEVYGAYGKPAAEVLTRIAVLVGLFLLFLTATLHCQAMTRAIGVFVALAMGGLVSYFLQATGFSYHKVPFVGFGIVACCLVLLQQDTARLAQGTALVVALLMLGAGVKQGFYKNTAIPEINRTLDGLGPFDGLTMLSSHVYTGPPVAIALNAEWISNYPAHWLVPGAINRLEVLDCRIAAPTCARLRGIAARNRKDSISDIARAQPELLIVDRNSGYFDRPGFDWLGFMAEDPNWAPLFASYRQFATSDRFLYFRRQP
jgi:hypothetical protein